jgi:hypothetical protein
VLLVWFSFLQVAFSYFKEKYLLFSQIFAKMNAPPIDHSQKEISMTLQEIISDIHALNEDMETYERKYGVLSETFYEAYTKGEEPEEESWVLDWADWAGAYKILLRRQEQYRYAIQSLKKEAQTLIQVIGRTARHEPIPVAS